MISMKCFFLFIVIIVLTWNSIVYANEEWKNAKNVYEFNLKFEGKDIEINNFKGNVLLMSNVTVHYKHYDGLIYLAKRYYDYGLRILVFLCDRLNENQNAKEDNSKCEEQYGDQYKYNDDVENKKEEKNKAEGLNPVDSRLIEFMNEFVIERENEMIDELSKNNVTIIDKVEDNGNEAQDLWKYMEYKTMNKNSLNSINPATFLVDKDGNNIKELYVGNNYDEINVYMWKDINKPMEYAIVNYLRPWESADNVYELELYKPNGDRKLMNEYSGKLLYVIKLPITHFRNQLLQILHNLANIYYKYGLIILALIENADDELCAENKKSGYAETIHIFNFDGASYILLKYIYMNIKKDMDSSPNNTPIIEEYFIDKEGNVANGCLNGILNFETMENAIVNNLRLWESAYNVHEFELHKLNGNRMSMEQFSGKVLYVIKLHFEKFYDQLKLLKFLADIYYKYGLRILAFVENANVEDCKKMIESSYAYKIYIFKLDILSSILWKYINMNIKKDMNTSQSETPTIEEYIIDKEGKVVKRYQSETVYFKSVENAIVNYLKPWEYANNVYGFELYELSGGTISMNDYSGKVLFLTKLQSENICDQLQSLRKLADVYYKNGLMILAFIESANVKLCAETIYSSYVYKIRIYKFDALSYILWKYIDMNIDNDMDTSPIKTPTIEEYIIDKEGKVVKGYQSKTVYFEGVKKYFEEYFIEPEMKKPKLHV